jgi:hypothetical protein
MPLAFAVISSRLLSFLPANRGFSTTALGSWQENVDFLESAFFGGPGRSAPARTVTVFGSIQSRKALTPRQRDRFNSTTIFDKFENIVIYGPLRAGGRFGESVGIHGEKHLLAWSGLQLNAFRRRFGAGDRPGGGDWFGHGAGPGRRLRPWDLRGLPRRGRKAAPGGGRRGGLSFSRRRAPQDDDRIPFGRCAQAEGQGSSDT